MIAPLLFAVLMATSVSATDKYVALEMYPQSVFPGCTPTMILRCSVNSTSSTTPGMGLLGETPVTVANVNSLIIKKAGVAIASVTYSDSVERYLLFDSDTPANIYGNNTNIGVGGSLVGVEEECGFLEVTWTDPKFSLNGTYECEANGLDEMGEPVSVSVTAGVFIEGANMAQMAALTPQLNKQIGDLEAELRNSTTKIGDLEAELVNSTTKIGDLEAELVNSTTKISELEARLAEYTAPNTEAPNKEAFKVIIGMSHGADNAIFQGEVSLDECYLRCEGECTSMTYDPATSQCFTFPELLPTPDGGTFYLTRSADIMTIWTQKCPPYWVYSALTDACYGWFDEALTWSHAYMACRSFQANLVTMKDENERDALLGLGVDPNNHRWWLSTTDSDNEGQWMWVEGQDQTQTPVSWTNWRSGMPNGGTEQNCGGFSHTTVFDVWDDFVCDGLRPQNKLMCMR